jgi:iron(III) transport system permease protein
MIDRLLDVPRRIRAWRGRLRASPAWTVAVAVVVVLMILPLITITALALLPQLSAAATGAANDMANGVGRASTWPHLWRTVLPGAVFQTTLLLTGVGAVTLLVGTFTAWIVTMYRFPGRDLVDRLLVIPLAMPTYIVAYCYVELLDYTGPVQAGLRTLFGWQSAKAYWFPNIRSTGGAVFVLSAVLYPYIYLSARASFVQQSVCALEVARTLGQTAIGAFWSVALPLARPAVVAGVALVLMECLNDLGAVQYLGVDTLTVAIYTTWLQRGNLAGAAQIALLLLCLVGGLFALEHASRGQAKFQHTTGRYRSIPFSRLEGWWAVVAVVGCALPFILGFALPCSLLLRDAVRYAPDAIAAGLWPAARNSVLLATGAGLTAVALATLLAYAGRIAANGFTRPAVRVAGLGYAIPGTVLALGVMLPLAGLDNRIDALIRSLFGVSTGLLLSGSAAALVFAYTVRFLSMALGSMTAGLERISPNLDAAARTLGVGAFAALLRVHLPMLLPSLGTAGLLVFVETMKELPATILMRPFNFETLATLVYNRAALEQFEQSALAALMIVVVGLIPVLALHRAVAAGRTGDS